MLVLYEHPLSSYAQKIKIALREKNLPFRAILPDDFGTGRVGGPLATANPRGEVPVLIDDGVPIFDSTIILEYVEEKWPAPPLLPLGATSRAFARITEDVCDTQYEALNWGFGEILWFRRAQGELGEAMRVSAARQTTIIQDWLTERLGDQPWFGGARFGWADAAVGPMVNRSVHYGLGPIAGSALALWHARIRDRPSVAQTFAEFDAAAEHMAAAADLYTRGGRRREYRDHRLEWMVKSGGIDVVTNGLRDDNIRFPWPDAT